MDAGWGAIRKSICARFEGLEVFRVVGLAALACLSLGCLIVASRYNYASVLIEILVASSLGFLPVLFLLRHVGLATLVVSAPLPGVLVLLAILPARDVLVAAGYCLGLTISILVGETVAASIVAGKTGARAARHMARRNSRLIGAVLAVFLVPALASAWILGGQAWLDAGAACVLAAVSAGVTVWLITAGCEYGEEFVARANRSHERFARLFAPILPVARPRFGFSVFGIACVTGAIAFFGATHLVFPFGIWAPIFIALPAIVSSYAVLHDWRRSFAVLLSTTLAAQIGLWSLARMGVAIGPSTQIVLLVAVCIVFALQLFVANEACQAIATEDDVVASSERSIETKAMAVCVAGLAGIAATLPFAWSAPGAWSCFAVAVFGGAVSAIVFQPAIAITIESVLPRAATVAARYRLK